MSYPFVTGMTDGLPHCGSLIGGRWMDGQDPAREVNDKFSMRPFAYLPGTSDAQITEMIDIAQATFRQDKLTPYDRGVIIERVAVLLSERRDELLQVMQKETGYTTADINGEISRTLQTLRLCAEEARRLTGEMIPISGSQGQGGRIAFTMRSPLGVVLAVTPFNAPLNTVVHKVAPAIGAGNVVVLKPAGQTPHTSCFLAQLFAEAGLPPGYLQIAHGGGKAVSAMMADSRVRYIAFTGSTEVGRIIQGQAGLRRTQMELGSIAFTIVADDANIDTALPKIVGASYRKAGQVCTSIQILLVHEDVADMVEARLTTMVKALTYGDPTVENCTTGPLISEPDAIRVGAWVAQAVETGARLLVGGNRDGSVVAPTLLADVSATMKVGCCEIFGPVLCIERYRDIEAAIARVNSTPYGLASGFFTNRIDQAFASARKLDVGGVHINETSSSRADMMPYGGTKESGFGREGPHYAMREMTEEKVISFIP